MLKQLKRRALQHLFDRSIRWRLQEFLAPEYTVVLDYPLHSHPRWVDKAPHTELYEIIACRRDAYADLLRRFLPFSESLLQIPEAENAEAQTEPHWYNNWFPGLDAVALYCLLALRQPRHYFEIGSGNSTKFARRVIRDIGLATQILSIDPTPRAYVDSI